MTQIAVCYCGEPLVFTMAFSQKEFVCVKDGRLFTYFGPAGAVETPALLAKLEANKEEWEKLSEGNLGGGVMLTACETCMAKHEPHLSHASTEEKEAHEAAVRRWRELRPA